MAVIQEELVLVDRFSATFAQYLRMGQQAASVMGMASASQSGYNDTIAQSGRVLSEMAGAAELAGGSVQEASENMRDAGQSSSQAAEEQKKVNRQFQDGASAANALTGKLKGLIATYLSFQGVRKALDWVGENLKLSDIQRNAENQLRAVLANMNAPEVTVPVTAEFQVDNAQTMSAFDAITQKAAEIQGKGIYGDEAMIAGAAELATYFHDAEAIMSMMDTLADYTMGMTGGGAVDKNAMVQYATDIGKIMSGSYVAMTRKGFEFTEAQQAIIEGTATQAQIVEALGAEYLGMSADMQAAAAINSVIAESWGGLYEVMSDTPEGKIIQLQNRMGDLREELGDRLYPAVLQLADVFDTRFPEIEGILTGLADACSVLLLVLSWIAGAAIAAADVIIENGDFVTAILMGIGAAALAAGAKMVGAALMSAAAWAVANWPLLLIAGGVALVIYRALQMGATWADVCGAIGGVLYELYALGWNLTANAWNLIAIFAEFLANVFKPSAASIAHLFADLADWALGILQSIASAIDAVFGSNLAGAVNGWRSNLKGWVNDTFGENAVQIPRMEKIDYGDAWTQGVDLGREFGAFLDGFQMPGFDIPGFDPSGLTGESVDLSGIEDALDGIGADTKALRNSVDLTDEDIKLLVNMAERRYVNNINLTAQTPVINVSGQNTGDTELDRRLLAEAMRDILLEQAASHTDLSYI